MSESELRDATKCVFVVKKTGDMAMFTKSQILEVIGFGVAGLVAGASLGGIKVMSAVIEHETVQQKDILKILKDYDSELVQTFLAVSCLRMDDRAAFTGMHRALVRLLTMEMYMSELQPRDDWPRTAFKYAEDMEKHCETLSNYTERYPNQEVLEQHLGYLKQLANDLAFNVKMSANRVHMYRDE